MIHDARLHARAAVIAKAIAQHYGSTVPEGLGTLLSYYVSCGRGYDRAAEQLIAFARTHDISEKEGA